MNIKKIFEGDKIIIHMAYWIIILLALCVGSFSLSAYSNEALASQISFGATLSGIILSVLAIIMTLVGEMKSDNAKDTLLNVSKELELIVENVKTTTSKLEKAAICKDDIDNMQSNIIENVNNIWKSNGTSQNESNTDSINYVVVFKKYSEKMTKLNEEFEKYLLAVFYYIVLCVKNKRDKMSISEIESWLNSIELKDKDFLDIAWNGAYVFTPGMNYANPNSELEENITHNINERFPDIKNCIDINFDK